VRNILKISVVIPTYNRRTPVACAIDSVIAQTVPVKEIIVVDDGSDDGTAEVIRGRYGSSVTVLRQENAGASAARNRGIRTAQGDWIAFLDSDDIWVSSKIERQTEALAALGDEFGVCFTNNSFGGDPNMRLSIFEQTGFGSGLVFGSLEDPAKCILAQKEPFFTSSLLIRRSLLERIGGFDEALFIREDTDLVFRLSFETKFCFVGESLVGVDRTPSRVLGLCKVYSTRDHRVYDCLEHLYNKWLAMPETARTENERSIRDLLRIVHYSSAEAKMHDLKWRGAIRELGRLRALGESYPSLIFNFLSRKVGKIRRRGWTA
jgi:glycosyltransferase involved in cell wall biosynthesis